MEHPPQPTAIGRLALPAGVLPLERDDPLAIGGHRLIGRLGSGGMGVVYLGWARDGALAAVKTALPEDADDPDIRHRYQSEVACTRQAPPDRTARLLVDGTAETPPYIVTEYVQGPSLAQVVDAGGPLPAEPVRELAAGVARALAAIHEAGLVHRDLKPGNVLLAPGGPRVIDFGIAQQVAAAGGLTRAGMVMGSPGWIPPERLAGGPATAASDVFGWGCLVAYAATGRNPFGRGDADELARRVLQDPPDLRGLHDTVRPFVAAALAKEPADRPTAAVLAARLGGGRGWTALRLDAPRIRVLRPVARRMASAGVAVAVAIAVILAAGVPDQNGTGGGTPPPGEATTDPGRAGVARTRGPGLATPPRMAGPRPPSRTPATVPVAAPAPVTPPTQNPTTGNGKGNGKGNGNGGAGKGKGKGNGKGSGNGKGR